MRIQKVLESYGFNFNTSKHLPGYFNIKQDDVDDILLKLQSLNYLLNDIDLINAGQENSNEWQNGLLGYTSYTGSYLEQLSSLRMLNLTSNEKIKSLGIVNYNSIEKVICPHCLKEGQKLAMARHHFTNCKLLREGQDG
jgi:hypothetical protein